MPPVARACVFHESGRPLEIQQLPLPELAPGELLVRVTCATICGSDLHTFTGRRQEATPTVLGHETIGRVERIGPGEPPRDLRGAAIQIGDRITWSVAASCGSCYFCRNGLAQKCESLFKYGHARLSPRHNFVGGLAEYCHLLPGTPLVVLPSELPDVVASPASCATATVAGVLRTAGSCQDRVVLVQGAGMLGLTAVAMLREAGASRVIIVDPDRGRLAQAKQFGADDALAPDDGLLDRVRSVTAGRGVDVALELSGSPAAIESGLALLRTGGRYVLAGSVIPTPPIALDPQAVVRRMLTIAGIHNYAPADLLTAVDFLHRRGPSYPFAALVAGPFPLTETQQAFEHAISSRAPRVAVVP